MFDGVGWLVVVIEVNGFEWMVFVLWIVYYFLDFGF